jgi:hypothetical protein
MIGRKEYKGNITQKLQRFLMTVARREGIEKVRATAVITSDNMIVLDKDNSLPRKEVDGDDIQGALIELMKELGAEAPPRIRYLGYDDFLEKGSLTRQFNFSMCLGQIQQENKNIRLMRLDKLPTRSYNARKIMSYIRKK